MADTPPSSYDERGRQIREAADAAAGRAAAARRRGNAAGARLAELRSGRSGGMPLLSEAEAAADSSREAAELARQRVLDGFERSAVAHDHSADAHDHAAVDAARHGRAERGGWHERAAAQARHDAGEDRARAEEIRGEE